MWHDEVDLLVLGTGAGGLAAAVTGAAEGLSTLVLETTEWLGGTTAYSAGTCWVPDNRFQRADGVTDDHAVASRYLDALVGDRAPRELREAYLTRGPEMIDYFDGLGVRFWPSKKVVDYHPEIDGAGLGGRALEPQTFDGRTLGKADFGRVRRPVPEFALFGGTLMVRRAEVNELLTIYKGSPRGVATALKLGVRWAADRLRYPRGTRLAMGNALVANLFARLRARGGRVWFTATATELVREDGRVVGAVVAHQGRELRVRARRGVVLAGGGFSASPEWRGRYLPSPTPQHTRAAEGATGATLRLAQAVGGALGEPRDDNAFWFPSSVGRRRDGTTAVFPHIWDRAKPGIVAVDAGGPPLRRRVGVLPPLRPRHVRRAGGARVARDRRRRAAPLRAGHGPPAHPRPEVRRGGVPAPRGDRARAGRDDRRGPRRPHRHRRRRQPGRRVRCG